MNEDMSFKMLKWFHSHILPNPSGQNQILDHFCPSALETFLLLSIPKIGNYLGLIAVIGAFYKELVYDSHWKNLFSKDDGSSGGPGDGRCDLFFRLAGCGIAYMTLLWRFV